MPAACAEGDPLTLPRKAVVVASSSHWTACPRPYRASRNGLTPHRSPQFHKLMSSGGQHLRERATDTLAGARNQKCTWSYVEYLGSGKVVTRTSVKLQCVCRASGPVIVADEMTGFFSRWRGVA